MIVKFRNGTDQQRAWFREALDNSWPVDPDYIPQPPLFSRPGPNIGALNVWIEVEFVTDPGPRGGDEVGYTTMTYDTLGATAVVQIDDELDNPSSPKWQGKAWFQEVVMHELSHVVHMRLVTAERQIEALCDLFEGGARNQWETGPWDMQIKEATTELVKDGLAFPTMRKYDWYDRTRRRFKDNGLYTDDASPDYGLTTSWEWFLAQMSFTDILPFDLADATELGPFVLPFVGYKPGTTLNEGVWETTIDTVPARYGSARYEIYVRSPLMDWRIRTTTLKADLYDANGTTVAQTSWTWPPGGTAPFEFTRSLVIGNLLGTARTPPIGIFEPERTPLTVKIRLEATFVTTIESELELSFQYNTYPHHPFNPAPPYNPVPSLIPSSILAYPGPPGWRRLDDRRIVGAA